MKTAAGYTQGSLVLKQTIDKIYFDIMIYKSELLI